MILVLLLLSIAAIFPLAQFDHWSSVPSYVIFFGYLLTTAGLAGSVSAQSVNKFAELSVAHSGRTKSQGRRCRPLRRGPASALRRLIAFLLRPSFGPGVVPGVDRSGPGSNRRHRADSVGGPDSPGRIARVQRIRRSDSVSPDSRRVVGSCLSWPQFAAANLVRSICVLLIVMAKSNAQRLLLSSARRRSTIAEVHEYRRSRQSLGATATTTIAPIHSPIGSWIVAEISSNVPGVEQGKTNKKTGGSDH